MKFTYTAHATERLAERHINKWQVERVLQQGAPRNAGGGAMAKTVVIDGQAIEVIYVRDRRKPGTYRVITVYPVEG